MLQSIQSIQGFQIGASDGEIGTLNAAYFDDAHWAIRYLVIDSGGWLTGRKVLISPRSILSIDWPNKILRTALTRDQVARSPSIEDRAAGDPHLRSSEEGLSYSVAARDGDIGHVEDLLFDDETWAIRYLVINIGTWWTGRHVLVSPAWAERIAWSEHMVYVSVTRAAIEASPKYDSAHPPGREFEDALHRHYRKPTYWTTRDEPRTPLSAS